MKNFLVLGLMTLASCASMNQEIKGYNGNERARVLESVEWKDLAEVKATLGEPVAEGVCVGCNAGSDRMELVYLHKTIPRYSLALSMANKSELGCFIVSLKEKDRKWIYEPNSILDQMGCAGENGAINSIRRYGSR